MLTDCNARERPSSNKYRSTVWLPAAASILLVVACLEQQEDERIVIDNDPGSLSERVDYTNETVPIDTQGVAAASLRKAPADSIVLTLVAEVAPPEYDGQVLQATDVNIKGQKAYVSYNMRGETFLGGVDVFDISDITSPQLVSSAIFTDTDVSGLTEQGGALYLASATERPGFDSPAVLEVVTLKSGLLTDDVSTIDLPSYAGTDVEVAGNYVYVTSGADGGVVTVLSTGSLEQQYSFEADDARGVSADDQDVGVVAGTPTRLLTFNRNTGNLVHDYILTGATIPFSKSTIEINRSKAILGVGDGGTQIVCLETGTVIEQITQPVVAGLDASVTVTNAATTYKKTLFMSNGEAGVYVALSETNFDSKGCDVDNLQLVGKFRFDDFQSVNHVAYRSDVLFIAGGLGGLKIVIVQTD
ncbi:hypothetical protein ACFL45_02670 [Candidatus Neomarinimicrobiota bacterium]